MDFWIHVANFAAIYVILALSLNLLVGYTGLFSVTQGALYGIGAYAFALASLKLGMPFPVTLLAAIAAPAVVGLVVALPSLRLSGDYLVIASLGLQTVIVALLDNLGSFTGGAGGLWGIPAPQLGPWAGTDPASYLPLSLLLAGLSTGAMVLLAHGPYGRALKMVRDDELAASAAGKAVVRLKVTAFVIGSAMAGIAGALYAGYVTFIDPSSFTVTESIYILTLVIIGGAGTVLGSLAGAVAVVVLGEALRFLPLPGAVVGEARQALYGLLLIAFVIWRPQGMLGERRFGSRRLEVDADGDQPTHTVASVSTVRAPNGKPGKGLDLECHDLVVGYDNLTVLRGVSVQAAPGEIVVIAGHNGAGKSTLLRAIAGRARVRQGRIVVRGTDVTNRQDRLVGADRIGLVPQTGGVFPEMTVAENLRLGGYELRAHAAVLRDRIYHVLELFPVFKSRLKQPARQLSGGQQRMLSLAMALVPGYRLLLLDEPSIGLSPAMVESTLATIQSIAGELSLTALLCEQNVRPALQVANRAYVLRAGRVAVEDSAAHLLQHRDLWRLF